MKIISIAIAFSAITLLMFCSCTKDKKATEIPIPIDYRDAYCGTFTGYETTRA